MAHHLTFFSKNLKFKAQVNVLPYLAYDIVLGQAWWCEYSASFDQPSNFVAGVNQAGMPCSAYLEGSPPSSSLLGTMILEDGLALPVELARFAPLFAPNTKYMLSKWKEHVFSFKFKEN